MCLWLRHTCRKDTWVCPTAPAPQVRSFDTVITLTKKDIQAAMALPALPTHQILPGAKQFPEDEGTEPSSSSSSPSLSYPSLLHPIRRAAPTIARRKRLTAPAAPPLTPRVVAEFGARCVKAGTRSGLAVKMNDPKQEGLLRVSSLREALEEYCVQARDAKLTDQAGLLPTVLFWRGDPKRGVVSLLGPKLYDRVYNLLEGNFVSDRMHGFHTVEPFGTPRGNAAFALFLDKGETSHGKAAVASFRYGRIVEGNENSLIIEVEGVRHQADVAVVAPSTLALGNVDVSTATRNSPPASEAVLERLQHLKLVCGQDAFTTRALNDALAAVHAAGLTTEEAGGGARVSARLQESAKALVSAARYLRGGGAGATNACTWSSEEPSPPQSLEKVAGQLRVLACRAHVADLSERPDILHSPDDDTFFRDLLDLDERPGKGKELHAVVKGCLATLAKVQPTIASRLRAHGLAKEDHRIGDEDYTRVQDDCGNSLSVAGGVNGAMEQLATMAKNRSMDSKTFQLALKHAAQKEELSSACTLSTEALVKKIRSVACRQKYRTVLKALGADRAESREETNPALAREVALLLESNLEAEPYYKDSELAACVIQDDKNIDEVVEEKLRAASPALEDKDVIEQIVKTKAHQREAIMKEQTELKRVCQSGPAGRQSNALAEELSSRSLLGPLLRKQGQVQLAELNAAIPAVQAYLNATPSEETKQAWVHRRQCKEQLDTFESSVRRALCRIRLTERLKFSGSDTQLTERWTYDNDRGMVAKGEDSETDELCVQSLDEATAALTDKVNQSSLRACLDPTAKKVVQSFCAATSKILLPVNFLDFLSILVYAALPSWPADAPSVREHWLKRRQRTLGGATGEERSCQDQEAILKIHAPQAQGTMSAGRATLRHAITEVLTAVEEGLDLEALSKCACASTEVLSKPARTAVTRATRWYWQMATEVMRQGQEDAEDLRKGREAMLTALLRSEIAGVSWWGEAKLKAPGSGRQTIFVQLWQSYLKQMFDIDGHFFQFRQRLGMGAGDTAACRLAMVDTFFFVVALDLIDISDTGTTSQEEAVLDAASAFKATTSTSALAATGALALAATSGLAGTVTGVGAVVGAAAGASALAAVATKHFGPGLYSKHMSSPTFAEKTTTTTHEPEADSATPARSLLRETYRQVFDATFFKKKKAVNGLLLQLCAQAFHEATHMESASADAGGLGALAALRLGEWQELDQSQRYVLTSLSPPLFFPLGPPDGTDPPVLCNRGIC